MAIRKKSRYRMTAMIASAALLSGNVWLPGNAGLKIYAEETQVESESEMETEIAGESEMAEETELSEETEIPEESESSEETELPEETEHIDESEPTDESESSEETELENETENPEESELPEETELVSETESLGETEFPEETEFSIEMDKLEETELPEESGSAAETEAQTEMETESEAETEAETEMETESEIKTEMETELETESETGDIPYAGSTGNSSYWDESWYVDKDFRFIQVEKEYGLVDGGQSVAVYEAPDVAAEIVGEIPYFGIVYVLKEADAQWVYVESGEVRGFLQTEYLADASYVETLVGTIGEESFQLAVTNCEKADNAAFTYTHTTVQEVLAAKQYSLVIHSGYIQEYPKEGSREIGKISSGSLVYLLEETDNGWFFVESGESRGFIRKEMLLSGIAAEEMVTVLGEEEVTIAETYVSPEENRSCYYTLKSVKSAETGNGEKIAELALGFAGKLPYVWGGTSLTSGADCSGFVQSIYAAFGISLPRLAQEQGNSGLEVQSIAEAQPGDVVYWANGPHVGIYIGHGQVVQCSGSRNNTADNPGKGVTVSDADYQPITSIRRFQIEADWYDENNRARVDQTLYTQEQIELIWAIVAQEDNGSYAGALAVISSAMNRTESANWSYLGNNALAQLMAPGQYCYSMDSYWKPRLNGNVPEYVKQAVNDCLKKGLRNHSFTSFRSRKGSQTGADAVQIGGNWFFGS